MKKAWDAIEQWLAKNSPAALASLRPGASAEDINALAPALGAPLPDELRELLSIHDGQEMAAMCGLLDGWIFLPASTIVKVHGIMGDLLRKGDFATNVATNRDGAVKAVWWSPLWIPFLEGPGGDLLCFDMDPAEKGNAGQIITFWKSDGRRRARSKALAPVLEEFADDLDSGAYDVRSGGGLALA